MKPRIQLLIIDPQNDFCDLPDTWRPFDPVAGIRLAPALPVPGAHADMVRLATFVREATPWLDAVTVTLDSHHRLDIAHPGFWQTAAGTAVPAFTTLTAAQVRAGEFQPRDPDSLPRTLAYLDELEARGRYTLMVWPVHCQIGSWGHGIHPDVLAACNAWEDQRRLSVAKVLKGDNPWTEHYSAVMAEVPDDADPGTQLNRGLIQALDRADLLLIAGEASSHCVRATTEQVVDNLPGGRPERVVLLTDCMSPVAGFDSQHEAFVADMRAKGVQTASSTEALARCRA